MKHYVITGAARGIGLELTKQALESGHAVSALVRSPEKAVALQKLGEKYSQLLKIYPGDVTSEKSVQSFAQKLEGRGIDVLINNAGVYLDGDDGDFEKLDLNKVTDTIEINTVGPMRVAQSLIKNLQKNKNSKLINITSLMGSIDDNSGGGSYAYRISKAALNMFTKNFSIEYPEITSFVVHPGWVQTDMGGQQAPTSVKDSAHGIHQVIEKAQSKSSGMFFDFEGDELKW